MYDIVNRLFSVVLISCRETRFQGSSLKFLFMKIVGDFARPHFKMVVQGFQNCSFVTL